MLTSAAFKIFPFISGFHKFDHKLCVHVCVCVGSQSFSSVVTIVTLGTQGLHFPPLVAGISFFLLWCLYYQRIFTQCSCYPLSSQWSLSCFLPTVDHHFLFLGVRHMVEARGTLSALHAASVFCSPSAPGSWECRFLTLVFYPLLW